MQIITQKLIQQALFHIKNKEIKQIIGRQRLKFDRQEISSYLFYIFKHSDKQKSFKSIYKKLKPEFSYQNFMNNIQLFSLLLKRLFYIFNKINHIKASKLLNIIDSTIIPEKQTKFINQKDWNNNRVTTRAIKKEKIRACGSKGLFLINRNKQIYHAELLNINESDQNYLKNPHQLIGKLKGILLADRGFSNKLVRNRLSHNKTDIFTYNQEICRLISPYHYKSKIKLTDKESKIYKRRWTIETLFKVLKDNYADNKLNLTGKYTSKLKQAKFYSTIIVHNLSTV